MNRRIVRFGWKPSLPDQRDLIADPTGIKTLPEVDPRGEMTPVYNQYQLGSCTANAVAAAIDYDRIVHSEAPFFPSRLGIYFYERKVEGSPPDQDTGAMGRDGFKVARKVGLWPEAQWAYVGPEPEPTKEQRFAQDPQGFLGAAKVKLERPYKAVPKSAASFKRVLSNRQTIAFGFTVYESFESNDVARTGIVPKPAKDEAPLGGHEMLIVGYLKSEPQHALVRNSWDSDWGLGGYCLFPWSYLLSSQASDFRTIYRPA